jgi:flavin reductase (DIM6/NTAB) family NADH-FMN oxidoreductase RutF
MPIEPRDLRTCLGHFATGVTVVTCLDGGRVRGLTVNAFTSVSLSPPLVLVSIDRRAKSMDALRRNNFTINVLSAEQAEHAYHFGGRTNDLLDLAWERGPFGPRLARCLAYLGCSPWRDYDGGDHVLLLGQVEQLEWSQGEPLLFFRGGFRETVLHNEVERSYWELASTPGWLGEAPLTPPQSHR